MTDSTIVGGNGSRNVEKRRRPRVCATGQPCFCSLAVTTLGMASSGRQEAAADDVAVLLFCEKTAALPGCGEMKHGAPHRHARSSSWSRPKGQTDDADVCLLRGVYSLQRAWHLEHPCQRKSLRSGPALPVAKAAEVGGAALLARFLRCAQAGALIDAKALLSAHLGPPGALDEQGLHGDALRGDGGRADADFVDQEAAADAPSTPTTARVRRRWRCRGVQARRAGGSRRARLPQERAGVGRRDLLRAGARGQCRGAHPGTRRSLARRPSALAPNGAARRVLRGHVAADGARPVRRRRCGEGGPTALQAAVAANQAAANALHVRAQRGAAEGQRLTPPEHLSRAGKQPTRAPPNRWRWTKPFRGRRRGGRVLRRVACLGMDGPAMERSLLRWIENELRLPVWLPVDQPLPAAQRRRDDRGERAGVGGAA